MVAYDFRSPMLVSEGVKPKGGLYMHYVISRALILLIATFFAVLPSAADAGKKKPGGAAGTGGVKTEDICEKEKVQKCTADKDGVKTCVWVDGTKCRMY
jgi:hypothetical protein